MSVQLQMSFGQTLMMDSDTIYTYIYDIYINNIYIGGLPVYIYITHIYIIYIYIYTHMYICITAQAGTSLHRLEAGIHHLLSNGF